MPVPITFAQARDPRMDELTALCHKQKRAPRGSLRRQGLNERAEEMRYRQRVLQIQRLRGCALDSYMVRHFGEAAQ